MTDHDPLNDLLAERRPVSSKTNVHGLMPGDHEVTVYPKDKGGFATIDVGDNPGPAAAAVLFFNDVDELRAWAIRVALDAGDPAAVKHDLAAALMQAHDRAVEAATQVEAPVAVPA